MFALLPPAAFLLLWRYYFLGRPGPASAGEARCWRSSFLHAALTCGVIVVASTEILSLVGAVAFGPLIALWAGAAVVTGVLLCRRWRRSAPADPLRMPQLPLLEKLLLAPVLFILLVTFGIAIVSPPNNWDSQVYHMARVAHWVQNRSVAFYPTAMTHQLHHAPLAEYAILHLFILWGGDRLANLVQWFSMAGCLVGISLVAARLGAGRRGQILAALICATIPMGILQASSTQNDYAAAFWLVCLAALILPRLNGGVVTTETRSTRRETARNNSREKKISPGEAGSGNVTEGKSVLRALCVFVVNEEWGREVLVGAALGLAVLTKATAYLYAAPLMAGYAIARLRRFPDWREVRGLLLIAAVAVFLNLGLYSRNARLFGSPIYGGGETDHGNASFASLLMASNVLRNAALHCCTPWLSVNRGVCDVVTRLHEILGVEVNDPRTTSPNAPFIPPGPWNHEDTAGNPLHLLLAVVALCVILGTKRLRNSGPLMPYTLCVVAAFLLFCFYLRWQPWNSRLHLPLFVLASAFMARALPEERLPWMTALAALALTAYSLGPLLWNQSRPVAAPANIFNVDRTGLRFANRGDLEAPYFAATDYVKERGYKKIGLYVDNDDAWEYPLWVLLGPPESGVRLEHVGVTNPSGRLDCGFDPSDPDAIIAITRGPVRNMTLGSRDYVVALADEVCPQYFLSVVVPR